MFKSGPVSVIWKIILYLGDISCALASWIISLFIRIKLVLPFTTGLLPIEKKELVLEELFIVGLTIVTTNLLFGFYDQEEPRPRAQILVEVSYATLIQTLILSSYFFISNKTFPRSIVVLYLPIVTILLYIWRTTWQKLYKPPKTRTIIIGAGKEALELANNIKKFGWHGLEVIGHVPQPGEKKISDKIKVLGTLDQIVSLVKKYKCQAIIIAESWASWKTWLSDQLARAGCMKNTALLLLPEPFESLIGRTRYRWVNDIPLIEILTPQDLKVMNPIKRITDIFLSIILIILALPILICAILAIYLTSGFPIIYKQKRVGKNLVEFTLYKLRTMEKDAEESGEEILAAKNDPRVTKVGKLLRSYRIDEIPQLVNVLFGDMSLVGPRPERPNRVKQFLEEVPGYVQRFTVKPGITGLAQVNGDYLSTPETKLRYDLVYISNWSLWMDISILFRTFKTIIFKRGI